MSRIFTVHPPPGGAAGEAVLIEEGFSWGAVLTGPLWFAWHRAWISLLFYLAGLLALVGGYDRLDPLTHGLLAFGFLWLVGVSANDALRGEWTVHGWPMTDVVLARNRSEALIVHVVGDGGEAAGGPVGMLSIVDPCPSSVSLLWLVSPVYSAAMTSGSMSSG